MKRYDFISEDICHSGCRIEEFDDGEYIKIEELGFQPHDGYIRAKGIVTDMAASLHQRFDVNAATLRFRVKDGEPIIIDIDQDTFEEFIKAERNKLDSNIEIQQTRSAYKDHGHESREKAERWVYVGNPDCKGCFDPHCGFERVKWQDTKSSSYLIATAQKAAECSQEREIRDLKKENRQLKAERDYANLLTRAQNEAVVSLAPKRQFECNCAEYTDPGSLYSGSLWWICPAHGYKKR